MAVVDVDRRLWRSCTKGRRRATGGTACGRTDSGKEGRESEDKEEERRITSGRISRKNA